jgi:hypothetical protein
VLEPWRQHRYNTHMLYLRKPFFFAALALIALVVLAELGSLAIVKGAGAQAQQIQGLIPAGNADPRNAELRDALGQVDQNDLQKILDQEKPPGLAIPALAVVDGLLLFSIALLAVNLVVRERVFGQLQGISTFIFSLVLVIAAIAMIFSALALLLLMVALFLAVPFGTLAYLAIYGFFNRGGAAAILGLILALKLGFAICLVIAQQGFLKNTMLVLLILSSFVASLVVSFLLGFVPGFLASITDALGAILVGICGAIWAIVFLITSIGGVLRALRFSK